MKQIAHLDKEYATNWYEEVRYLTDRHIRYTFVKEVDGITVWKYKKTKELFEALSRFYGYLEN